MLDRGVGAAFRDAWDPLLENRNLGRGISNPRTLGRKRGATRSGHLAGFEPMLAARIHHGPFGPAPVQAGLTQQLERGFRPATRTAVGDEHWAGGFSAEGIE